MLTELRRAAPDGLDKEDLQEKTGVGPGDLRAVLDELTEGGAVEATDSGWELTEGALDGVLGQTTEAWEAEAAQEGQKPPQEASEAPEGVQTLPAALEASAGPIRARIVVDVMFFASPGEDPLEEAGHMRVTAVSTMSERYPELQVSATLESVDVFDAPRRIFPGG